MKKEKRVAQILLDNRRHKDGFWPWLHKGKNLSLKNANKFLLGCILDYQIPAHRAWDNAKRLAEDILGDPANLWQSITSISQTKWNAKQKKYSLHRFPEAHARVWRIGKDIVDQYDGDSRLIWKHQSPSAILDRLNKLKVGEQISRMIVGALWDEGRIKGMGGDVKIDIHVRRVLGRVFQGEGYDVREESIVLEKTRKMHPDNPWLLDQPLYLLGKKTCVASNPRCEWCYLNRCCKWFKA